MNHVWVQRVKHVWQFPTRNLSIGILKLQYCRQSIQQEQQQEQYLTPQMSELSVADKEKGTEGFCLLPRLLASLCFVVGPLVANNWNKTSLASRGIASKVDAFWSRSSLKKILEV